MSYGIDWSFVNFLLLLVLCFNYFLEKQGWKSKLKTQTITIAAVTDSLVQAEKRIKELLSTVEEKDKINQELSLAHTKTSNEKQYAINELALLQVKNDTRES